MLGGPSAIIITFKPCPIIYTRTGPSYVAALSRRSRSSLIIMIFSETYYYSLYFIPKRCIGGGTPRGIGREGSEDPHRVLRSVVLLIWRDISV
ncbi:unnamed protein product [Colletotrichum noveboracense]|uniref:Uncharacterized protein n=1 Tax=Colletotrichum noveboracense TaxID=2664923 RepID=A0A9W4WG64_9PEZI|nr:unnamed protein product [Colletotrichum noveboracense]